MPKPLNLSSGRARAVAAVVLVVVLGLSGFVIVNALQGGSSNADIATGDEATVPTSSPSSATAHASAPKSSTSTSGKSTDPKTTPAKGSARTTPGANGTSPIETSDYRCGTDSQFSSPAYQYDNIVNSNGYNTYVQNNMWAAQRGTSARLCTRSPGDWFLDTSTQRDDGGAVQTYPQIQQLFNDFCDGQWNTCSNGTSTPISRLTKLTSNYAEQTPSLGGTGAWEVAYDVWLSNTPQHEIMVWVITSNDRGTGGAKVVTRNASIGGATYNYQVYGGNLPQLVLTTNQPSASIDLLAVLKFLQSQQLGGQPVVAADAAIDQVDFGIEICDTGGQTLHFATTDYGIAAAAN